MTEDEAKTKWCPFARHQNGSGGSGVNRVNWDRTYDYANCIGSGCMAWRWDHERHAEAMEAFEESAYIGGINTREEPVLGGFCGLAGRP